MRCLAVMIICAASNTAVAADPPTCLIVKHASTARQVFVSGANWQYVEGDFPRGMKWKSNVTDRTIRKVKEMGGKVVTIPNPYSAADLDDARKQCKIDAK